MFLDTSLKYLSDALPASGRVLSLRTSFNQSLINSLKYLLGLCDEIISTNLFLKVSQKLESLNPEAKLSGLLGVIHKDLFNAIEQKNIQKINYISKRLDEDSFIIQDVIFVNFSDLTNYYSPRLIPIFSQERIKNVKFYTLSTREFDRIKATIQVGLRILKDSFSDFFREFQDLANEIVILHAQGLKQGSSSEIFGMIYKSSLFRNKKITDAIDFIIHEQSHLYVHLLNHNDQLILNPLEKYESPLRVEKRPLIGIYHATFVLARVYYVLSKALELNEIPEEEKNYCQELIAYYKKRFHVGFETLQKHAQMTPLASALIQSASKLV